MASLDKDPEPTSVSLGIGNAGGVEFDRAKFDALDGDAKRAILRDLAHMIVTGEMKDGAATRFEQVGATMSVNNPDGSVDQATMIGGGMAANEHTPPTA